MKVHHLTAISLSAALMAVLSQFTLPIQGIPLSFQVFGVVLCGCLLGRKKAMVAIGIWLLLGAMGAPVFSSLQGGLHHLMGYTGGFLWGFLLLAGFCRKDSVVFPFLGVLLCHLAGVLQWMLLSGNSFWVCLLYGSLLYLPKDFFLAFGAIKLSKKIKRNGDFL